MTDKIISNGMEFGTAFSRERERERFSLLRYHEFKIEDEIDERVRIKKFCPRMINDCNEWKRNDLSSSIFENYLWTKIGGFLGRTIGEGRREGRGFGWHKRFRYQLAVAAKPIHPYYNAERY